MEDKLAHQSQVVRKRPTEADYLYPTGFDVGFRAECWVTVRVGASTAEEAGKKVQAMLPDWSERESKDVERILGVPSFEDSPSVSFEILHITKKATKGLCGDRVELSDDVIRDWLIDSDEFPEEETRQQVTPEQVTLEDFFTLEDL